MVRSNKPSNKPRPLWVTVGILLLLQGLNVPEARARTHKQPGGYVLPPISPKKMRELLDPGPDKLPHGYRFAGAQIDKMHILARYRSPSRGGRITVELGHTDQTVAEPLKTRKFALRLHGRQSRKAASGPELVQALAAHIRTKEASWRWIRVALLPAEARAQQARKTKVLPTYTHQLYLVFVLLLLLAGPLLTRWYQRRWGAAEQPHSTTAPPDGSASPDDVAPHWPRDAGWDRYDLGALGLVALFVASVAWPMMSYPITGDEATNLEPAFWSLRLLGGESSAHPPLFRFLIHLTARDTEPLWLLRGPVVLCAALALGLFWRLARRRAPANPWTALALTAALAISGNHWQHAFEQKSLWLWLLLLLAAHRSFERALAGEHRYWTHYVVWSTLAVLTHYLSVAYLAGHFLYVVLRRRRAARFLALALAPAALAVLPLSLAILHGGAGRISGYDPAHSYFGQLVTRSLVDTGLVAVLLAAPAAMLSPREDHHKSGLFFVAGLGFAVTLALSSHIVLWSRHFFPVLPFGLLWLASRLRLRDDHLRPVQMVSVGLAVVMLLTGISTSVRQTIHAGRATTLHAAYRRAAPPAQAAPRPRVVLLHPGWRFPMVYYTVNGRRHLRDTGCQGQRSPYYHVHGDELLAAVPQDAKSARLDRLLDDLGQLDVLLYTVHDGSASGRVLRWIRAHCRPLVVHRSTGHVESGTAFRCRASKPGGANVCAALKRFSR